jgi:hypothetical protein
MLSRLCIDLGVRACARQVGEPGEVEGIKAGAAVLKRLCRQRTLQAWKEWRRSVEAAKRAALQVGCLPCSPAETTTSATSNLQLRPKPSCMHCLASSCTQAAIATQSPTWHARTC